MVIIAAVFSVINGNVEPMVANIPLNAKKAFDLSLNMVGVMAFWLGLMKIAEDSGVTDVLVSLLRPLMQRVFPEIPPDHPAMGSILLSMASNIMGLNNAATPISIRAMQAMQKLNANPTTATNGMCLFVVINASSVQLIPTTGIAYLASAGSLDPGKIVITVLIATTCSTIGSVTACLFFQKANLFNRS
tara:strand:- start:412 stop:978 length:567 start_codon:yes stop_codon:yes gene_type:complete